MSMWVCTSCEFKNLIQNNKCAACFQPRDSKPNNTTNNTTKNDNTTVDNDKNLQASNPSNTDIDNKVNDQKNDINSSNVVYNDMIDHHDDDDDKPKCICGSVLIYTSAQNCYPDYNEIYCDICSIVVCGSNKVYHCDKQLNKYHDNGYDLCPLCAVQSKNEFVTNLLTSVLNQNDNALSNIIISPLSITSALSLALCGAANNTLKQMITVLFPDINNYQLTFNYAAKISSNYMNLCQYYTANYRNMVIIANKIWINKVYRVSDQYLTAMGNVSVEYIDNSNPKIAANKINNWCSTNTKGLIKKVLEPADLALMRMVITNAIYFKAEFELAFPLKNTRPNIRFYETIKMISEISKVKMMYSMLNHTFCRGVYNGLYDAVKLYYKRCNKCLSLILIKSNVPNITDFKIEDIKNIKFKRNKLKLYVPKFEYECSYLLNDILSSMGMDQAFDANNADFSNMSKEPVYISAVIHKAYVSVDEKGTKAAAVTAVVMRGRGRGSVKRNIIPTIRFDHIFNFYIMEEKKQTVLFAGRFSGNTGK